LITLSIQGQSAYRDLKGVAKTYDDLLTQDLSEEELHILRTLLLRLAQL